MMNLPWKKLCEAFKLWYILDNTLLSSTFYYDLIDIIFLSISLYLDKRKFSQFSYTRSLLRNTVPSTITFVIDKFEKLDLALTIFLWELQSKCNKCSDFSVDGSLTLQRLEKIESSLLIFYKTLERLISLNLFFETFP